MKTIKFTRAFAPLLAVSLLCGAAYAQKRPAAKPAPKAKPIIFAVVNDGKQLEPIALIDKGELVETVGGDAEPKALTSFASSYYKPKATYNLIFGGGGKGTVTVNSSNTKSECAKNIADVTTISAKAKIKGLVMGLATNETPIKLATGVRRFPTPEERSEIEELVRAEYSKEKLSADAIKTLHYHNLTALDVDNDGKAELVGSYWAANTPDERNQLFFIAEKDAGGKYTFTHSEYKKVTTAEIMGGADIKALDDGIYNELLLDVFEYNGDTTAEIFTITQGFEGNSFTVYKKQGGKWTKAFEGSNYHCAF